MGLTSDQVRDQLNQTGFTYDDLNKQTVAVLVYLISKELSSFDFGDGKKLKLNKILERNILHNGDNTLAIIEIRCSSCYFKSRQAVTFGRDGFVGVAGWAATKNKQPFLRALVKWNALRINKWTEIDLLDVALSGSTKIIKNIRGSYPALKTIGKVLRLPLKREWFDMILNGIKKEEYRTINEYFISRLFIKTDKMPYSTILSHIKKGNLTEVTGYLKDFDTVAFANGYDFDSPKAVVEFKGLEVGIGNSEWGAKQEEVFKIKLGNLLATSNVKDGI